MKQKALTLFNVVLTTILSLFGVTSCFKCEYGSPEADYYAEGYVLDEEDKPIEGITVKYGDLSRGGEFHTYDSINTDSKGKYLTQTWNTDRMPSYVTMVAVDESGVYASDTAKNVEGVQVKKSKKEWHEGKFKFSHTFHLKKKEQQ